MGEESYVAAKSKNVLIRIVLQLSKQKRNQLIMLLSELWMIVRQEMESEATKGHPMVKLANERKLWLRINRHDGQYGHNIA